MLKVKNLNISVESKPIINNAWLEIKSSEIHVIMGKNGSGKSSLVNALMGHPKYELSGSVEFLMQNLLELPVEKRARLGIFLASQYSYEIPGVQVFTFIKEAYRNLVSTDIDIEKIKQISQKALQSVGLDISFLERYLNEGFSGGEKRRFEIAQMIIFKPKLAILDEIDSGLDSQAVELIINAIQNEKQNNPELAILAITHYKNFLDKLNPDFVYNIENMNLIQIMHK